MSRRRWDVAVRARTLLALFAAVPILAGAFVGITEVRSSRTEAAAAEEIETRSADLVLLSELSAAVIDERNRNSAIEGIRGIGLTSEMLVPVTGLDLAAELEQARTRVDALLVAAGDPELDERIRQARIRGVADVVDVVDVEDLAPLNGGYDRLEFDLNAATERQLDDLLRDAGGTKDAEGLVAALRVLELATEAREAVAEQTTSYFGAQFGVVDPDLADTTAGYQILIQKDAAVREAHREIRRIADADSIALAELDDLQGLPEVRMFAGAVNELVTQRLTQGDALAEVELVEIFAEIDNVTAVFEAGNASSEAHLDLVSASGADVRNAAEALRSDANGRAVAVAVIVVAGVIGAVLATWILLTTITRPLRELAEGATRLRDGRTDRRIVPTGPRETRQAALALNDAAASLELFQEHTASLADGELPELDELPAPSGALGEAVVTAVETLADSIAQQESFRTRLAYEAGHDSLTQIANRRASIDRIRAALQRRGSASSAVALLFVDLDGFKAVNDDLGHRAGDVVLAETADRLRRCVREDDHIGRLGGDEFVVVLEGDDAAPNADLLAERLLHSLAEPIALDVASVSVEACIGIAVDDQPDSTPESLLHDADLAVYEAKASGRSTIRRCDDELRARVREQSTLDAEIRTAIAENQFELWHQPLVHAETGETVGIEALLRWNHPDRGLTVPGGFVLFAERSDLILDIDRWVLDAAATELAARPEIASMSVNVSSRHVASHAFVDDVLEPLRTHGVEPARLVVEVTESAVLDDLDGSAAKLAELRGHGIRIALDDFGTGYASISHLRLLPLDIVKVDRSFTHDTESRSLARLIIETGHLLGLSVTAEGVETEAQAAALRTMGVDVLQGYHYRQPTPLRELQLGVAAPTAS